MKTSNSFSLADDDSFFREPVIERTFEYWLACSEIKEAKHAQEEYMDLVEIFSGRTKSRQR
jgi:hypothetical protein